MSSSRGPGILILEPDGYSPEALRIYRELGEVHLAQAPADAKPMIETVVCRLNQFVGDALLKELTSVRRVVCPATGTTHIDLPYLAKRGIDLLHLAAPEHRAFLDSITSTAELTLALILAVSRNVVVAHESVLGGEWQRDPHRGTQLSGKTLGIIGLGRVGSQIARYAAALGLRGLGFDPELSPTAKAEKRVEWVEMAELLQQSDIVSLHIPQSEKNQRFFSRDKVFAMKKSAILINTSRGEIVDESALCDAIEQGHLSGCGLDVLEAELDLVKAGTRKRRIVELSRVHRRVVLTPHIGGCTLEAMARTEEYMADYLRAQLRGKQ